MNFMTKVAPNFRNQIMLFIPLLESGRQAWLSLISLEWLTATHCKWFGRMHISYSHTHQ